MYHSLRLTDHCLTLCERPQANAKSKLKKAVAASEEYGVGDDDEEEGGDHRPKPSKKAVAAAAGAGAKGANGGQMKAMKHALRERDEHIANITQHGLMMQQYVEELKREVCNM